VLRRRFVHGRRRFADVKARGQRHLGLLPRDL
jgi:hypothetical protein